MSIDKLENLGRTEREQRTENREQTDRQTENSITEATLTPVDCRGEWANMLTA